MSDLWADAYDLRLGLRCMQSVVRSRPWEAAEYARILDLLRRSRRQRQKFLATLRADLFFEINRNFALRTTK